MGLTQEQKESYATLCIPDSIYGLTLAWVTSENSTKQLEYRLILTQSSSLDPIFSAGLTAPVSGVDCPCPWLHANCLSAPFSNQLSFVSSYHFRIRRDFRSKNPLSGFAPKQTKESSAWRATYIVLHVCVCVCVDKWECKETNKILIKVILLGKLVRPFRKSDWFIWVTSYLLWSRIYLSGLNMIWHKARRMAHPVRIKLNKMA